MTDHQNQAVEDWVNQLIELAADERIEESPFDEPVDCIVHLWRTDSTLCREVILASIRWWEEFRLIGDGVEAASDILSNDGYLDVLYECTKHRKLSEARQLSLLFILIDGGKEVARDGILKSFRRLVNSMETGKARDNVGFVGPVMELCRLRLDDALPDIDRLLEIVSKPRCKYGYRSGELAYLQAASLWFTEGVESLWTFVKNKKLNPLDRSAYAYCIGCNRNFSHADGLAAIYHYPGKSVQIDLNIAIVEAIVYLGADEYVERFLVEKLSAVTTRKLLAKRGYNAEVRLLINASRFLSSLGDQFASMISRWRSCRNRNLAALACIALRDRGLRDSDRETDLANEILSQTRFLQGMPSMLGMMELRRAGRKP